jgi:tight adherence protein B
MDPTGLMLAVLTFLAIGGVGWALAGGDPAAAKAAKRAKTWSRAVNEKRNRLVKSAQDAGAQRKKQFADAIKDLEQKERKARAQRLSISGQLTQAGLAPNIAIFWCASAGLGVLAGGGLLFTGAHPLMCLAGVVGAGLGVPRWLLQFLIQARQKKFLEHFADAIDIIVRGVRSGLPLNECLKVIARESPEPVRTEFLRVVDGIAVGAPMEQILQRSYNSMPLPEVNFFNTVLLIQMKAGGNLSEALGNLSGVLRARKLMREKIKAMSSEAVASGAIIGSLPFAVMILIYVSTPSYISELFTDPTGHMILGASAVLYCVGIFVMQRMINFKY